MIQDMDTIRLNRLSDPNFVFGYSIWADKQVMLREPNSALCANLRNAIDYARCFLKEMPFCIKCKQVLNEENLVGERRFLCWNCRTEFDF